METTPTALSEDGTVLDSENEAEADPRPASPTHDRVQTEVSRQRTPSPMMMQMGTLAPPTQSTGQMNHPVDMRPNTEITVESSDLPPRLAEAVESAANWD